MRSSMRSGRVASVGPARRLEQPPAAERRARRERIPVRVRQRGEREPERRPRVGASLQRRDERRDLAVELDRRASSSSCRSNGESPKSRASAVDRRLEAVGGSRRRGSAATRRRGRPRAAARTSSSSRDERRCSRSPRRLGRAVTPAPPRTATDRTPAARPSGRRAGSRRRRPSAAPTARPAARRRAGTSASRSPSCADRRAPVVAAERRGARPARAAPAA